METLKKLQNWYFSNCNGEWEHQQGLEIGTIDNPGWSVKINLISTKQENVLFEAVKLDRDENDWIRCSVENKNFNAACGPLNLDEVLEIFLKWAQ